jgi:hypothetical protein
MSSRTHSPSGGTANTLEPVAVTEDVGASFVPWLAAVGADAFETIDNYASQGLWVGL